MELRPGATRPLRGYFLEGHHHTNRIRRPETGRRRNAHDVHFAVKRLFSKTRGSLPPSSRSLRIAGFGESSVSTGGKAAFDHRSLSDGRHPGQGPPRDRVDFRRCNRIVVGRKVFAMLWGVRRQQGGHRVKAAGTGLEIVIDRVSY